MKKNTYSIVYDKEINDTVQNYYEANRNIYEEIKNLGPSQLNAHIEDYMFKNYLTKINHDDKNLSETLINYYQKIYYSIKVFEFFFVTNQNIINFLTTIKCDIAENKIKFMRNNCKVKEGKEINKRNEKLLNEITKEDKSESLKNVENEATDDRKLIDEARSFLIEFRENVIEKNINESNLYDCLNYNLIKFTISYLCELDEISIISCYYLNRMIAIKKYVNIEQIQYDNNLSQIINNKKQAEKDKYDITNKAFFTLVQNIN